MARNHNDPPRGVGLTTGTTTALMITHEGPVETSYDDSHTEGASKSQYRAIPDNVLEGRSAMGVSVGMNNAH